MKRLLSEIYLVWILYGVVILGFRLLLRGVGVVFDWDSLWFLIGGFLGLFMFWVDRFVYIYMTKPHEQLSMQVKMLIGRNAYQDAVRLLLQRRFEQTRLSMNNILFIGVWLVLALFMVTSSISQFAQGMVMAIGLKLVVDVYVEFDRPEVLVARLFWPVARNVNFEEAKWVVGALWIGFLVASVMSV